MVVRATVGPVSVDLLDRAAVLRRVGDALAGAADPVVLVSANLDHLHHFARPGRAPLPGGRHAGAEWLTLLDGVPLTRAVVRRAGAVQALPGSELLPQLLGRAAERRARVALVGGSAATREAWSRLIPGRWPGLVDAGTWAVDWSELDRPGAGAALAGLVGAARPDVLVVSLGKPRQERWLADWFAATGARVALPFGSAVDYLVGTRRRPPAAARRLGLEWAVRLAREPLRLGPRYLLHGPPALLLLRRDLHVEDAP